MPTYVGMTLKKEGSMKCGKYIPSNFTSFLVVLIMSFVFAATARTGCITITQNKDISLLKIIDIKNGPWLQNVSNNGITIMWESAGSTPGGIAYGPTTKYGLTATATTATSGRSANFSISRRRQIPTQTE